MLSSSCLSFIAAFALVSSEQWVVVFGAGLLKGDSIIRTSLYIVWEGSCWGGGAVTMGMASLIWAGIPVSSSAVSLMY